MGPVQVLVVGFDEPRFSGEVLTEFTRLEAVGIVRLVDLLLVSRAEDGTFETVDAPDSLGKGRGATVAALLADGDQAAAADADDGWSLADAVPAGSVAAVALIEHLWAEPLRAAIQGAGGRPLEETWLAPGDVDLLETLQARPDRPGRR